MQRKLMQMQGHDKGAEVSSSGVNKPPIYSTITCVMRSRRFYRESSQKYLVFRYLVVRLDVSFLHNQEAE